MEPHQQLGALIDLAEDLGMVIRSAPGGDTAGHPGGAYVRFKGKEIIFLDPAAAVTDQIAVIAGALRGRAELEGQFLPPELRELIDRATER